MPEEELQPTVDRIEDKFGGDIRVYYQNFQTNIQLQRESLAKESHQQSQTTELADPSPTEETPQVRELKKSVSLQQKSEKSNININININQNININYIKNVRKCSTTTQFANSKAKHFFSNNTAESKDWKQESGPLGNNMTTNKDSSHNNTVDEQLRNTIWT